MTILLLVDDDEGMRDAACRYFTRRDFEVIALEHPRQALEVASLRDFDVAVLDITLPEMSGIELLHQLRELSDSPVIMLSGSEKQDVVSQATNDGAFAFLRKPCSLSKLQKTIEAALA